VLKDKLLDPASAVLLYGTTPPREGTGEEAVRAAADKLAARLAPLPLDGVVVYDIQDESGRTAVPRPFAFTGTIDPRAYARLLAERTGRASIAYKSLGNMEEPAWQAWLAESARDYGVGFLSIVGRPTSGVKYPLALSRAIRIAAAHAAGFSVGGVAIAERHTAERSEAARLLGKSIEGCGYFISQTVYAPEATERLLADYLRDCRGASVQPRRIVLTFAPAAREKTMAFLHWLGVRIPPATARSILESASPLQKSIEVCRDNLRRLLDHPYAREIPLGINVESVSINRDEIDASIELVHVLAEVMKSAR
jgi:5,10-methylenetetrahydrofolate reductase